MRQQRSGPPRPVSEQFLLIAQALQNLAEPEPTSYDQKRGSKRFPRSLSVSIQPLDEDFQPDGDQFWLVSRDISIKGVGLISPEEITHQYVRLGLMQESISIIGRVRHSSSIGTQHPLYLVGVEFLDAMQED